MGIHIISNLHVLIDCLIICGLVHRKYSMMLLRRYHVIHSFDVIFAFIHSFTKGNVLGRALLETLSECISWSTSIHGTFYKKIYEIIQSYYSIAPSSQHDLDVSAGGTYSVTWGYLLICINYPVDVAGIEEVKGTHTFVVNRSSSAASSGFISLAS